MAERYNPSHLISITHNGRVYNGSYVEEHKGITVRSGSGHKFAVLHASPPEFLAKVLLRELIDEGKP